jgi:hypothetical protein
MIALQEMQTATLAVIERMVEHGWIKRSVQSGNMVLLDFTDEGEIARSFLRRLLLDDDGHCVPEVQIAALLSLISRTS